MGVGAGVGIGVSVSGGVSAVGADGDSHSVTCGLEGFRVCFCVQVGEKLNKSICQKKLSFQVGTFSTGFHGLTCDS